MLCDRSCCRIILDLRVVSVQLPRPRKLRSTRTTAYGTSSPWPVSPFEAFDMPHVRPISGLGRRLACQCPGRGFSTSMQRGAGEVRVIEVGPRDGLQNESTTIPLETKLELIRRLAQTGVRNIEAGSFVAPKWVPQVFRNKTANRYAGADTALLMRADGKLVRSPQSSPWPPSCCTSPNCVQFPRPKPQRPSELPQSLEARQRSHHLISGSSQHIYTFSIAKAWWKRSNRGASADNVNSRSKRNAFEYIR